MSRPAVFEKLTAAEIDDIEQHYKAALLTWLAISGAGDVSWVDMEKSCLLRRLCDGKQPLSQPPPTAFSAPWYELIEDGKGNPHGVYEDATELRYSLIIDQTSWAVEKQVGPQEWLVRYLTAREIGHPKNVLSADLWRVYKVAEGKTPAGWHDSGWRIERVKESADE